MKLLRVFKRVISEAKEPAGKTFHVKSDRIDHEIRDKGYTMDKRTKAHMAHINPNHFVHMTTKHDAHADEIKAEAGKFDHERFHKERQTPTLHVQKSGNSHKVIGHEGRHRMAALAAAGHTKVPVVLKYERGEERKASKSLKLGGEHRGSATVSNVTPVHHDHKETLKKHFAKDD